MLQQLGDRIKTCQERAEQCREAAASEIDERVRQQLLDLEQQWQLVAESYQFIESLERLLLDQRSLPPEVEMLPEGLPPGIGAGLLRGRLELIPCTAFSAETLAVWPISITAENAVPRSNVPRQFRSIGQRSPSAPNVGARRFPLCRLMSTW
jgi:hypothetical protein